MNMYVKLKRRGVKPWHIKLFVDNEFTSAACGLLVWNSDAIFSNDDTEVLMNDSRLCRHCIVVRDGVSK